MKKATRARCKTRLLKRVVSISPAMNLGDYHDRSQNSEPGMQAENGHRSDLILQDELHEGDSMFYFEEQRCIRTCIVSAKISASEAKPGTVHTNLLKEFLEACQDLRWMHDMQAPHCSETKGVAEISLRRG